METYLHNFQFKLKTDSAKKMYTEVLETKSYDWLLPHEKKGYYKTEN